MDLLIWVRRNTTIIEPQTDVGKKWIKRKMQAGSFDTTTITIQSDTVEDFFLQLKEDDISYEER